MLVAPAGFDPADPPELKFMAIVEHSLNAISREIEDRTEDWPDDEADQEYDRCFAMFIKEADDLAGDLGVSPLRINVQEHAGEYWPALVRAACTRWAMVATATAGDKRLVTPIEIDPDFRGRIRELTGRIRRTILAAGLDDATADRLLERLGSFERELDRRRTTLASAISIWLDVTQAIGAGANNLAPVVEAVERLVGTLRQRAGEALGVEVRPALPKGD